MNLWNAYTGPRDPINCPFNQENPALYDVARKVTFDAGFPTWTDPRNGKVYHNPKFKNKRRKNDKGMSQNQKRRQARNSSRRSSSKSGQPRAAR